MADTRQRFQGKCFLAEEGHKYMNYSYDRMPPAIRRRLMDSPFNLCPACIGLNTSNDERYYRSKIESIEAIVLAELGPFGPQPSNPEPLIAKSRRRRHVARS